MNKPHNYILCPCPSRVTLIPDMERIICPVCGMNKPRMRRYYVTQELTTIVLARTEEEAKESMALLDRGDYMEREPIITESEVDLDYREGE